MKIKQGYEKLAELSDKLLDAMEEIEEDIAEPKELVAVGSLRAYTRLINNLAALCADMVYEDASTEETNSDQN